MRLARCSAATAAPAGRFVTAAGARGTQHGNLASPAHTLQHNCASSQRASQTGTPLGVAGRCKRQRHNAARPGPAGAVRAQTRPDALASRDDLPPSPPSLTTPEEEATVIEEIDFLEVKEPIVEERAEGAAATVIAALVFGAGVWGVLGEQKGAEFFAGYLLEQSLSVDNLFVFILVFKYFKTPVEYQSKVLTYGIATAAVLRLVLIVVGVDIVERFEPVLLLFAAILLVSSFKLLLGSEDDEEEDLSENKIVQFVRSIVTFSDAYDGDKFFTVQNGVRVATPLLLVLLVVELSDVVFAVDSIPAVFGVTLDPFIVYSSNIFAILSLRGLYSFVSTVMKELRFLDKAVALVLGFVGGKILADFVGYHVPTDWSLGIVASILGVGVGASLLSPGTKADAE